MNGLRLDSVSRISDGVTLHQPLYRPVDGALAADVLIAALRLGGVGGAGFNVDGSVTPQRFWYACPALKLATIRNLSISVTDETIDAGLGGLGLLGTGLGLDLVATDGSTVLVDLTAGIGISGHADLIALGADVQTFDPAGGPSTVAFRWNLATPIELGAGQSIRLTVNDDLTALVGARAIVGGDLRTA